MTQVSLTIDGLGAELEELRAPLLAFCYRMLGVVCGTVVGMMPA